MRLNPQTLTGVERDIYGHQLICLNPNHPSLDTPQPIRDWLDLIYQSIHSPERPVLNEDNAGVRRAAELISFENLTPEERALAKEMHGRITVETIYKREEKLEIAGKLKEAGIEIETIVQATGLTLEEVAAL